MSSVVASLIGISESTLVVIGWIASVPYSGSAVPATADKLLISYDKEMFQRTLIVPI